MRALFTLCTVLAYVVAAHIVHNVSIVHMCAVRAYAGTVHSAHGAGIVDGVHIVYGAGIAHSAGIVDGVHMCTVCTWLAWVQGGMCWSGWVAEMALYFGCSK